MLLCFVDRVGILLFAFADSRCCCFHRLALGGAPYSQPYEREPSCTCISPARLRRGRAASVSVTLILVVRVYVEFAD